jgi:hypothetical protein
MGGMKARERGRKLENRSFVEKINTVVAFIGLKITMEE